MKQRDKKGFTLVEVVIVIAILAILFILLLPAITKVTTNSRITLNESKQMAIESAAEKYGNAYINNFQGCNGLINWDNENCTINPKDLFDLGYIENEESLINPVTNEEYNGKIVMCFKSDDISIEATYLNEGESYECKSGGGPIDEGNREIIVTLNPNGGEVLGEKTKTVKLGETYGELGEAEKTGYTFDGWYTGSISGVRIVPNTIVTNKRNHTLYARYSMNKYTITYNANGGYSATTTQKYNQNSEVYSLPVATKSGCTFDGWYTDASGGTKITTPFTITQDMTVYAHYTSSESGEDTTNYKLVFKDGSSTVRTDFVPVGTTVTDFPTLSKNGYIFHGWGTSASSTTPISSIQVNTNVILYAIWESQIKTPEDVLEKLDVVPKPGTPNFNEPSPKTVYEMVEGTTENSWTISNPLNSCHDYSSSYVFNPNTGRFTLKDIRVSPIYSPIGYQTIVGKYLDGIGPLIDSHCTLNYTIDREVKTFYKVTNTTCCQTMSKQPYGYSRVYYTTITSRPKSFDYSTDGVYKAEDEYGTSYYYRGAGLNNYVKFAGFYWRIIRVNGDGTLRVIYDGTEPHEWNSSNNKDRFINTSIVFKDYYNTATKTNVPDNANLGYMYYYSGRVSSSKSMAQSNTSDSDVKKALDTWYSNNIEKKEESKYVSDNYFCNDRSTANDNETWFSSDTKKGYKTYTTYYGASRRLNYGDTINPSLKCLQKNDRFTVSDTTIGNGKLKKPIGLITMDEVVFAGATKKEYNYGYYLYRGGYWYWTMSPYKFDSSPYVYVPSTTGRIASEIAGGGGALAPVINLSLDFINDMTGDGTKNNPFQVIS